MSIEEQKKRQAFSVNVADDKKEKWAAIAREHNRPMGWLVNEMIDRMIAANSIHIYGDSPAQPQPGLPNIENVSIEYVKKSDIDEILKGYIQEHGVTKGDIGDLSARISALEQQAKAVQVTQKVAEPEEATTGERVVSRAEFNKRHGCSISRDFSKAELEEILKEHGLECRYVYRSIKSRRMIIEKIQGCEAVEATSNG